MLSGRKSYFITIAEAANITKAAQLLRVSQPSLSQYINRLEQELGVKLLERNYTPLRLTKAGEMYLKYVREIKEADDRFELELDKYKQQRKKTLSIGIPAQLMSFIFKRLVQSFAYDHPKINVKVKEGTSLSVMDSLIKDDVEIAFFHSTDQYDSRFTRYVLEKEKLYLVCNRDSILTHGRRASRLDPLCLNKKDIPELEKMRFLTLSPNYLLYHVMGEYLKRENIYPREIFEIPNASSIVDYITIPQSRGVSMLSRNIVDDLDQLDELTFFHINGSDPTWYLTMNYLSDTPLSEAGECFWLECQKKIDILYGK